MRNWLTLYDLASDLFDLGSSNDRALAALLDDVEDGLLQLAARVDRHKRPLVQGKLPQIDFASFMRGPKKNPFPFELEFAFVWKGEQSRLARVFFHGERWNDDGARKRLLESLGITDSATCVSIFSRSDVERHRDFYLQVHSVMAVFIYLLCHRKAKECFRNKGNRPVASETVPVSQLEYRDSDSMKENNNNNNKQQQNRPN